MTFRSLNNRCGNIPTVPSHIPGADWKCCGEKTQSFTAAKLKKLKPRIESVSSLEETATTTRYLKSEN